MISSSSTIEFLILQISVAFSPGLIIALIVNESVQKSRKNGLQVAAGAASGATANGAAGGLSKWADGTNTITGNGGAGGTDANAYSAGGTGVGGDLNIPGGQGEYTRAGGSTPFSMTTGAANVTGITPTGYGGGGGNGYSSYASGAGAPGIVIVWEYK